MSPLLLVVFASGCWWSDTMRQWWFLATNTDGPSEIAFFARAVDYYEMRSRQNTTKIKRIQQTKQCD